MRVMIWFALLGATFAAPKNIQKVVGGHGTTIQKYPFITDMHHLDWGLFWIPTCGGTLLTSYTVLSAAHCYYGDQSNEWRVRLGSTYASFGGSIHDVLLITIHPQYNFFALHNDIAIVRLANPAQFSDSIQAASIAGPFYTLPDNTDVVHIGWGSLEVDGHQPEQLQEVTVQIISHPICIERYANLAAQPGMSHIPRVTADMLCSGVLDVGGKDTCQGDSGGPLIIEDNVVVGVVSWGVGCADPLYPRVNTRVSHFADWISANGAA